MPSESLNQVLLFTADNEMTAGMVEALLKDNGIPVLRKYRGAGLHMKILLGNTMTGIDLYVPAAEEEKAKELIDILFAPENAVFEDEPDC